MKQISLPVIIFQIHKFIIIIILLSLSSVTNTTGSKIVKPIISIFQWSEAKVVNADRLIYIKSKFD